MRSIKGEKMITENKFGLKLNKGAVVRDAGNSIENKTGGWRTFKPVINKAKCIKCGKCWVNCPDIAVYKKGDFFYVNYDYCKGCGICASVCPVKCIAMELDKK